MSQNFLAYPERYGRAIFDTRDYSPQLNKLFVPAKICPEGGPTAGGLVGGGFNTRLTARWE
jgi:hypothetical protein